MSKREIVVVALVTLAACRSAASTSTSTSTSLNSTVGTRKNESVVAFTGCTSGNSAARDAIATLSVTFRPAPVAGAIAKIQIEGETTKSITRDSTEQIHRFELQRGLYDVRISMPGFLTATARITLTADCAAELSATLRRRDGK